MKVTILFLLLFKRSHMPSWLHSINSKHIVQCHYTTWFFSVHSNYKPMPYTTQIISFQLKTSHICPHSLPKGKPVCKPSYCIVNTYCVWDCLTLQHHAPVMVLGKPTTELWALITFTNESLISHTLVCWNPF